MYSTVTIKKTIVASDKTDMIKNYLDLVEKIDNFAYGIGDMTDEDIELAIGTRNALSNTLLVRYRIVKIVLETTDNCVVYYKDRTSEIYTFND